jgi:hypothetical protein
MSLKIDFIFPHIAPDGYAYEFEEYNTRLIAIWLCHQKTYDFNLGKPVRSIWGFYSHKKRQYFAPINSKTPGKEVDIQKTRNFTAMPIKESPLDQFFV